MGGKGNKRHVKRIASSRYMRIGRKTSTYVAKPMPGRHNLDTSISLLTVLKEHLLNVDSRTARHSITRGEIEVNGRKVREERYPLGFGDIIKIVPTSESYSITSGKLGTFKLVKTEAKHQTFKVVGKHVGKGGKIQIRLHDGTVVNADNKVKVNDSVTIGKKGIEKVIALGEGKNCYVIRGTHASESGKIKSIGKGTMLRDTTVKIEGSSGEFETLLKNIMVIGE